MSVTSGIYMICNKANGKVYIGSGRIAISRLITHRQQLRRGTHPNKPLLTDWASYGEAVFEFPVIEKVEDVQLLEDREQHWIEYYESWNPDKGYNQQRRATRGRDGGTGIPKICRRGKTGVWWVDIPLSDLGLRKICDIRRTEKLEPWKLDKRGHLYFSLKTTNKKLATEAMCFIYVQYQLTCYDVLTPEVNKALLEPLRIREAQARERSRPYCEAFWAMMALIKSRVDETTRERLLSHWSEKRHEEWMVQVNSVLERGSREKLLRRPKPRRSTVSNEPVQAVTNIAHLN